MKNKIYLQSLAGLFVLAASLTTLSACSGGGGEKVEGIVDHVAIRPDRTGSYGGNRTSVLASLDGDIIELSENMSQVSPSVNGFFSAKDEEKGLYFFYKTEKDPKPIGEGYLQVGAFTGQFAPVVGTDEQVHYVNQKGEEAFPVTVHDGGNFFDGRALVMASGLFGFIDDTGELVIRAEYVSADRFNEGYAVVWKDESEWAVIDRDGKEMVGDKASRSCPVRSDFIRNDLVQGGYLVALNPDSKTLFVYDVAHPDQSREKTFDGHVRVYSRVYNGRLYVSIEGNDSLYNVKDDVMEPCGMAAERVQLNDLFEHNSGSMPRCFPLEVKGADKTILVITRNTAYLGNISGSSIEAKVFCSGFDAGDRLNELVGNTRKPQTGKMSASNLSLNGQWSNNADPNISMRLSDKYGNYDGYQGYGYLTAANEAFELDFILQFTAVTPDGKNMKVKYDQLEVDYGGDPDDMDAEVTIEKKKVGEGELTVVGIDQKQVRLISQQQRINNVVLTK